MSILTPSVPATEIKEGERWGGLVVTDNGASAYHLILLPGDIGDLNHADAKARAAELGGELPTKREYSLLVANLRDEFQKDEAYWTSEAHESDERFAWCQGFDDSVVQSYYHVSAELRVRAVRRSPI